MDAITALSIGNARHLQLCCGYVYLTPLKTVYGAICCLRVDDTGPQGHDGDLLFMPCSDEQ